MATLRLFASVRQAAGVAAATVEGATVGDVLAAAVARFGPAFEEQLQACRIWRNGVPAEASDPVGPDDEVAALPPVSGGAGAAGRLAVLSMHTSPLLQPGAGDSGGMNVYVRELSAALAHRRTECSVYVRRFSAEWPPEICVEPGLRVVHIPAGPPGVPKEALAGTLDAFTEGVLADIRRTGGVDAIHAHYWLSGVAGHRIKHALDRPLVTTFHTLARVKESPGEAETTGRARAEEEVVACSDVVCANGPTEAEQLVRLYGAPADRVEIVAPGVEHALFSPGDPEGARAALDLGPEPVLLFVGRVQPLKGLELAVRTLAALGDRYGAAKLLVVGGPSGQQGRAELARVRRLTAAGGLEGRVRFVAPQPHHRLATYYRAADVVLVPSRSESFGLVALEAAACGTPVVAAEVGGLKALVRHGRTGFLVADRDPRSWAQRVEEILEDRLTAAAMALEAAAVARGHSWDATAELLAGCYRRLQQRRLVECLA
ncbi:MAG: glycosyltransferase [bacterium]|nr:glycosyltransferase [bacterium]